MPPSGTEIMQILAHLTRGLQFLIKGIQIYAADISTATLLNGNFNEIGNIQCDEFQSNLA